MPQSGLQPPGTMPDPDRQAGSAARASRAARLVNHVKNETSRPDLLCTLFYHRNPGINHPKNIKTFRA